MQIVPMKQHDRLPELRLRLCDDNFPNGVDLTSATEVRLLVKSRTALKVNAAMTVADQSVAANRGIVSYPWAAADTDTAGDFNMEVQVTWPPGKAQTWPVSSATSPAYLILRVQADLGP